MLRTPGRSGPKYLCKIDIVAVYPHSSVQPSDVRTKPLNRQVGLRHGPRRLQWRNSMKSFIRYSLVFSLLLVTATFVIAQSRNTGEIRGLVTDSSGAALPGATV